MQSNQFDYKGYLNLIRRRKELFLVLALLLTTLVFALSYLLPKKFEARSTVFIEKNMIGEMVKGIGVAPPMDDTISVLAYAITSRWLMSRAADSLGLCNRLPPGEREATIKSLQLRTMVKLKDRNLFTISYTDSDPARARDFVNTLVRIYIQEQASAKLGQSRDATVFLSQQMKTSTERLEKAEQRVKAYKLQMGGVMSLDEGQLLQENVAARQKLNDLQLRRTQLEGLRQITPRVEDPLETKLAALQKQLDDLLVQYTEHYPGVIQVRSEIARTEEQLKGRQPGGAALNNPEVAKIDAEIAAIRASEEGLRRNIATNALLLRQVPSAKAGLEKLEAERENEKKLYEQLSAREGQSKVSEQMEFQDKAFSFRIVDPAILPMQPVSPNRLKIMLVGVVAALAGSFGALLLLERVDSSVKDLEFVKALGTPVLAVIPRIHDPAAVVRERTRSICFLSAAFLYLLLMLCFPAMELLGIPYMDQFLDRLRQQDVAAAGEGPSR